MDCSSAPRLADTRTRTNPPADTPKYCLIYYAKIMNRSAPNSAAHQMIESPKSLFSIMAGASQADGHLYVGARNSLLSQPAVARDFIGSANSTTS